ncbi:P-loop containing nucleoside triphosphate hydrolase protein [Stipitochalara longipes BDJ]|nr:P-loop containing nucleoside triphosphate hydrolase protein [Stipitochalara longipes BDJ]
MDRDNDTTNLQQRKRRKFNSLYTPSSPRLSQTGACGGASSSGHGLNNPEDAVFFAENDGLSDDISSVSSLSQPRQIPHFAEIPTMIDWRRQLCMFLQVPSESKDTTLLKALQEAAAKLEEAERLSSVAFESRDHVPRYQVIHRVNCAIQTRVELYPEEPFVVRNGPGSSHIRGIATITNFELYLERNKAISFIAYKDYRCCDPSRLPRLRFDQYEPVQLSTLLTKESVSIISADFCAALNALAERALVDIPHPTFEIETEFSSPYLWWFQSRGKIAQNEQFLDYHQQEHISLFEMYLKERLGKVWDEVDALLSTGRIMARYIEYLYAPNTILVSNSEHKTIGQQQAHLAQSWLNVQHMDEDPENFSAFVDSTCWTFDGNFAKRAILLSINGLPSTATVFNIQDLMWYPIQFAKPELKVALQKRGEMFWKCRFRNYVCYRGESNDGLQSIGSTSDPRFMIDIATYKQMHPSDEDKAPHVHNNDELGIEIMLKDIAPQEDEFLLCLPKTIPGFNMNKKEWDNLDVSRIADVHWNTAAFDSLVVDKETKELISALVTNQIDAEKSTDLMSGKGNGLFILLHGGPGTGKTLTAESVAEYSKKPLYRVTCGDIGTKAEEVEKYLEVVMLLGKTWGCVVLLDEADVFLEQRKIFDLARNALVSVFLRVLEYYDGILILTSNRVGLFDEAFKSRIQLTLRYKNLEEPQRLQVWENFIARLESFQSLSESLTIQSKQNTHGGIDMGINSKELRKMLPQLAVAKLNGREIRNAVSTARQLAMFRKEPMGYEHLRVVIEEAKKFDAYLLELNKGFTSDQIMKDGGER